MFEYHGVTIAAENILKYCRKSRSDDPLLTIDEVLEKHDAILDRWCEVRLGGLVPTAQSFREVVSGETIAARPEFQTILRLIEQPQYKAILTVDAQRLSRGDLEDAGRVIKLLRYTNTFVITPDAIYDLSDEYDRERFKRELERGNDYLEYYKKINQRGRLESLRAGWYIGNTAPYGYDKDWVMDGKRKRPTLKINEREAEAVRLAFDWYVNEDMGMTNIAHRLNALGYPTRKGSLWSTATIKCMLQNKHYAGFVVWNRFKEVNIVVDGEITKSRPINPDYDVYEGRHPAIIDADLFERAQAKKGRNTRTKSCAKIRNPLAGLVWCKCGRAMSYRTYKDKDGNERNAPRLLCDNQAYCGTYSVTYHEVLEKVIDALRACIADFEIHIKNNGQNDAAKRAEQIKRLETRLADLRRKELSQWEKYSEEGMPKAVFDKLNEKVLAEIEAVTQAIEEARNDTTTVAYYAEKVMLFRDALDALLDPNASAEHKNKLLKACIERIDYNREGRGHRYAQTPFELDITLKA
ncbi:MAG: recombinase family protein [Bacteroidaceae bacterium]|nr:recombinase family protein [Bacteroidaceae bacterium]